MRLRVEVDAQRPLLALCDTGKKTERGRCFADTSLGIEDRDNRHVYKIRFRTKVTATSARMTIAKIARRIVATRFHWNRLSAESSAMPMPPVPTRPPPPEPLATSLTMAHEVL